MRFVISIYKTFRSFKSRLSYNENIINNYITIVINSLRSTRSYNMSTVNRNSGYAGWSIDVMSFQRFRFCFSTSGSCFVMISAGRG